MTYKIKVFGVVQGVGFRPYVYNESVKRNVTGTIRNVGDGVEIITNEKTIMLDILKRAPILSRIDKINMSRTKKEQIFTSFEILKSEGDGYSEVPADLFMCGDCLNEFLDKNNKRFYHHPFVSCTNCGPRFSITKKSPYDRINTSMHEFEMCDDCKIDYKNPKSRRYHAQTICCNNCGPKLKFSASGKLISDKILDVVTAIKNGEVVAIKGIGGFHLVCLLSSTKQLRKLTGRPNKPYAIMVKDIVMAKKYVDVNDGEIQLLSSNKRPIVVVKKNEKVLDDEYFTEVSELDTLGVMLPYTALHYLLFEYINEPLVCTSSNYPDEPITFEENQQFSKYILTHDRLIVNRIDDSVIKVIAENCLFLRRSRGFVPSPIIVDEKILCDRKCDEVILALGAEMTNTISVFIDGKIYQSQYLGTISNADAYENYKKTVISFLKLLKAKPTIVLCDLHPTYNSSRFAKEFSKLNNIPMTQIQHHVAHAYSVAIEHNLHDFIAITCDGLGYGENGKIWGGEVFHNDKRIGHLEEFEQIGGDLANIDPSRLLFSIMKKVLNSDEEDNYKFKKFMLNYIDKTKFDMLNKQLFSNINCPITSSTGRLFDAVSYMLGFFDTRTYEGRGAQLLEANSSEPYDLEPVVLDNVLVITPLFKFLFDELKKKSADKKILAATAQLYVAKGFLIIANNYMKENKLNTNKLKLPILFSGGCAYNRIMTSYLLSKGVLINKETASGDGGISVGQIGYYLIARK